MTDNDGTRSPKSIGRTASPTVTIVEDDTEMRAMLRDFLRSEGFRVHEESDGDRLIDLLESARPTVMVLDKEMPGVNGLDLLSYVTRRYPSVPVIVITAFGGPDVRAEALRRGATHYIEKPFRVATLLDAVRSIVDAAAGAARA
jgi:DNA-binding response OmpR family regulator